MTGFYTIAQLTTVRKGRIQRQREGILPFSRMTLLRMVGRGDFPKPTKIGRVNVWPKEQVEAWCSNAQKNYPC